MQDWERGWIQKWNRSRLLTLGWFADHSHIVDQQTATMSYTEYDLLFTDILFFYRFWCLSHLSRHVYPVGCSDNFTLALQKFPQYIQPTYGHEKVAATWSKFKEFLMLVCLLPGSTLSAWGTSFAQPLYAMLNLLLSDSFQIFPSLLHLSTEQK
jgi:hypothetical protein